ncbi:hypothetical protein J6590_006147 [Homalodisca vitripennis]|nr:hypothetical protein J6590_006143 [Homalodisca vitripennis]KAG8327972.1 hypothetical protein J6590_006147 [Homalodisca vitripennis]
MNVSQRALERVCCLRNLLPEAAMFKLMQSFTSVIQPDSSTSGENKEGSQKLQNSAIRLPQTLEGVNDHFDRRVANVRHIHHVIRYSETV